MHLYGHVHNSLTSGERIKHLSGPAFNVGVDVNNFAPVSLDTLLDMAAKMAQ